MAEEVRFFDNRQRYLLFVTTTNEKAVIAEKLSHLINELKPVITPPTLTKEIFVPADLIIGEYRSSLEEFTNKGYKIDVQKMRETEDQTAYAIPSPARRKEKSWVLDPVPLVKSK